MVLHVRVDNEGGQSVINLFVHLVLDYSQNIETRQDRLGEINIVLEVKGIVVVTLNRVGSCDDTASSLKTCHDTSLTD
jgi:hypothetical protein